MKLIGVTGGVGMGKSTAESLLQQRGVRTVDTDLLARELVMPGQPALAEIAQRFGEAILTAGGQLDRKRLANLVFPDPAARHDLEAILHPRIQSRWQAEVQRWRDEGSSLGAVVIPLLFETRAESFFDVTACVACSAATQNVRLKPRGWTPEQTRQRIAAQWSTERKMAAANVVVWTEGSLQVHGEQWDRILASLEAATHPKAGAADVGRR
jgi:dephospho-CoA kinase